MDNNGNGALQVESINNSYNDLRKSISILYRHVSLTYGEEDTVSKLVKEVCLNSDVLGDMIYEVNN